MNIEQKWTVIRQLWTQSLGKCSGLDMDLFVMPQNKEELIFTLGFMTGAFSMAGYDAHKIQVLVRESKHIIES